MSQDIVQKYEQRLKTYYSDIGGGIDEHVGRQKVREWLLMVVNDQKIVMDEIIMRIKQRLDIQYQQWIDRYLSEVANIQTQKVQKVQFAYEQCLQILQWLVQLFQSNNNHQDQQQQQQSQNDQSNLQQQQQQVNKQQPAQNSDDIAINDNDNQLQKDQQQQQQNSHLPSPAITNKTNNSKISPVKKYQQHQQQQKHQQQLNEFSQNITNSQPVASSIINKLKHSSKQQSIMKLQQQDQRYRQYIQTIFEHYCKINFGLTKDNTFQSMQKHVSIITINKFMIFINDFEIPILIAASMPKQGKQKMNKVQIRNLLMDNFKKSSQFHKQMDFEQFFHAINKIGEICFSKIKQNQLQSYQHQQNTQTTTKFSYQMVKMIKYMEISSFKQFKQKMTKLNINFSLKFNKQLQQKKIPLNYKFKYETNEQSKKLEIMAKPPMPNKKHSEKINAEENFKKQKHHLQMAKPPMNPKMSIQNIPTLVIGHNNSVRQRKGGSTKILPSHLNQIQRKDRNIISFQSSNNKNGKSLQQLFIFMKHRKLSHPAQVVVEGYVNIHLAKKGMLALDQNKNSMIGIRKKGEFQLNNVIEEARKQTQTKVYYDYQDGRSGRAMSNLSASKPYSQYSREPVSNQSHRNDYNREDIQMQMAQNSNNSKSSRLIGMNNPSSQLMKSRLDPLNELQNLIDFNQSDEDQYLDQHLKKEKDHDTEMGMRVEKKISQFNYKM